MTYRIKLTKDDFSPVSDYLIYLNGNDETIKQILDDQEKAEQLETVSDKLGNELQVKVLEIEELKGIGNSFMKFSEHYKEEYEKLKQKLAKIEEVIKKSEDLHYLEDMGAGEDLANSIKTILGDKK